MTQAKPLALISGGTSGIGLGIARALAPTCDLALGYEKNHARAEETRESLRAEFPASRMETYAVPLFDFAGARELVSRAEHDFGRPPLTLVHAAGRSPDEMFFQSSFENQARLVQEQLVVGMALTHLCLEGMFRAKRGRILFLSSISGHIGYKGKAGYAAAKGGLEAFARVVAIEVAHRGITVNCIVPGLIRTPLTERFIRERNADLQSLRERIPVGRIGEPEEVGALAAFLCGEQAKYITGTSIFIDGGMSIKGGPAPSAASQAIPRA